MPWNKNFVVFYFNKKQYYYLNNIAIIKKERFFGEYYKIFLGIKWRNYSNLFEKVEQLTEKRGKNYTI